MIAMVSSCPQSASGSATQLAEYRLPPLRPARTAALGPRGCDPPAWHGAGWWHDIVAQNLQAGRSSSGTAAGGSPGDAALGALFEAKGPPRSGATDAALSRGPARAPLSIRINPLTSPLWFAGRA